jgi:glycosyltransferase involved in cell wall biosynthesis
MGDFELIVSDDGSSDSTEEVCREYAARDHRVRYFRNSTNLRMPGNLNIAISRARSPLIANLHDGDVYSPNLLAKWRRAMDDQSDAAFVFNALEAVDQNGGHLCFHKHSFGSTINVLELTTFMLTQLASPVWGTVMARRSCYEKSGPFRPKYGFVSDVEMWMRLNVDYPVAYIADPLIKVAQRELTHPYAYIDWDLEQSVIAMRRDIINILGARGLISVSEATRTLRRLRERRWIYLAGSCLKRRRGDLLLRGLTLFRGDESLLLKSLAALALPLAMGSKPRKHS